MVGKIGAIMIPLFKNFDNSFDLSEITIYTFFLVVPLIILYNKYSTCDSE